MRKVMVFVLVMMGVGMMNAMDLDLANRKKKGMMPKQEYFCCLLRTAVPPCDRCFEKKMADKHIEQQPPQCPKPLSSSQEMERRCP